MEQSTDTIQHTCHWPGCSVVVPPRLWGCKSHWYKLPKFLRDKIWATYRSGQEIDKNPSEAYIIVAKAVQQWISAWENPELFVKRAPDPTLPQTDDTLKRNIKDPPGSCCVRIAPAEKAYKLVNTLANHDIHPTNDWKQKDSGGFNIVKFPAGCVEIVATAIGIEVVLGSDGVWKTKTAGIIK